MDKMDIHKKYDANKKTKWVGKGRWLIFALAIFQLAGCVKDDLYNTPHPDKGAVQVTTDWTGRSSDAVVPDSYILRMDGKEQTVNDETNAFKSLFLPGTQNLLAYHQAEGITISGTTATVNMLEDGTLNPMPGFLFSASKELTIQKDDTLKVTLPMMQRIRTLVLTLKLNPGEELRIGTAAATLTGMASSIDLTTGTVQTTGGKTVVPAFAIGTNDGRTRAAGNPVLAATVRLLGVVSGEKQVLTLVITLVDGYVQTISTDLTELLKNFGHAEMEPLELDATLELPVDGNYNGEISGWDVKDDITIDAD